jgi:hypothetical protein
MIHGIGPMPNPYDPKYTITLMRAIIGVPVSQQLFFCRVRNPKKITFRFFKIETKPPV